MDENTTFNKLGASSRPLIIHTSWYIMVIWVREKAAKYVEGERDLER